MIVSFEWTLSEPDELNLYYVRERLVGHDGANIFGPLPRPVAEALIKARRAFVSRRVRTRMQALQLFTRSPTPSPTRH